MKLLLILFFSIYAINAQAALYKYKNKDGEIIYSDKPPYAGANEMTPPFVQSTPAVKYKAKPKPEAPVAKEEVRYHKLEMAQPTPDETIRSNEGNITINLALAPDLDINSGHYINYYLDGKIINKRAQSPSATYQNVDRGTHNLKAEVRNKKGKLLKSTPIVTVHLHRFSKLHKKATPPPSPPKPANP